MIALPDNEFGELQVFAEPDGIAGLCLTGEFDQLNSPRIVEEAEGLLAEAKDVILDLSDATFIDSSVVNALFRVGAVARTKGRVVVLQLGTAAIVERVVEICDIESILPRANTRSEALDMIRRLQRRDDQVDHETM